MTRGMNDPPTLESLAVREGLALADDLNVQHVHLASDCKVVIDDLKRRNPTSYGAILHEITEHKASFAVCNIEHEFRSSNFETHNLAKHVLKLGGGPPCLVRTPRQLIFYLCKH